MGSSISAIFKTRPTKKTSKPPSPCSFEMMVLHGDLTKVKQQLRGQNVLMVQQINCLSVKPNGLSEQLRKANPNWNAYAQRQPANSDGDLSVEEDRGVPGCLQILDNSLICILGQWRPGKAGSASWELYPESDPPETLEQRRQWFASGLSRMSDELKNHPDGTVVAFPWNIGCGQAGGHWPDYKQMVEGWAEQQNPRIQCLWVLRSPKAEPKPTNNTNSSK